jgi:tellurite resistance protein TehA-like permease
MIKKALWIGLALSVLALMAAAPVSADEVGQIARTAVPETAGNLTVIVLIGCVAICLGTLLMLFRRSPALARNK